MYEITRNCAKKTMRGGNIFYGRDMIRSCLTGIENTDFALSKKKSLRNTIKQISENIDKKIQNLHVFKGYNLLKFLKHIEIKKYFISP